MTCIKIGVDLQKAAGKPKQLPKLLTCYRFENVTHPDDNIMNAQWYMTICTYNNEGIKQNCPDEAHYPWLETEDTNPCGGNIPCKDCVL